MWRRKASRTALFAATAYAVFPTETVGSWPSRRSRATLSASPLRAAWCSSGSGTFVGTKISGAETLTRWDGPEKVASGTSNAFSSCGALVSQWTRRPVCEICLVVKTFQQKLASTVCVSGARAAGSTTVSSDVSTCLVSENVGRCVEKGTRATLGSPRCSGEPSSNKQASLPPGAAMKMREAFSSCGRQDCSVARISCLSAACQSKQVAFYLRAQQEQVAGPDALIREEQSSHKDTVE